MATPVPPPAPRHLRLLRLLLSGLVLGAALNGATASRPGERALGRRQRGALGPGSRGGDSGCAVPPSLSLPPPWPRPGPQATQAWSAEGRAGPSSPVMD
jgi:hypothetical protein